MQVDLSGGKLKEIIKYKYEEIIELNISYNGLEELPEWINQCVNLQKLYCHCNELESLSQQLPNSLQELHCSYNQLNSLPEQLPNSLQEFYCYNNQLKSLPMSLLNCRHLNGINYHNNQIENIHPAINRLINRIKYKDSTIYNDSQSVHDSNVQESIRKSIINILKDLK